MSKITILDLHFQGISQTIAAFLVATDEGPVLVETGPYSTFPHLKKEIEAQGYQLRDIQHVLLSHIHLDHAGASWALAEAGARVYVHPAGYRHLHQPGKLMASARRIYQEQMDTLWGDTRPIPASQLQQVEHGTELVIGNTTFKAWHTPGHAIHHIAWQLDEVIFTGDVAGVKIGNHQVVPPCPPPDINLEDWKVSIRLLRSLNPTALYLTHFGPVRRVADHLDQLEDRLEAWANWMLPHYQAGRAPETVVPEFQQFVRESLLADGVDENGLIQYEAANPAYMSVAGLMRYWKKKLEVKKPE